MPRCLGHYDEFSRTKAVSTQWRFGEQLVLSLSVPPSDEEESGRDRPESVRLGTEPSATGSCWGHTAERGVSAAQEVLPGLGDSGAGHAGSLSLGSHGFFLQ